MKKRCHTKNIFHQCFGNPKGFPGEKADKGKSRLGGWLINWKILILALDVVSCHLTLPREDCVRERLSPLALGSWGLVLSGWKAAWVPQSWVSLTSRKDNSGEKLYFVVEVFKCKKPSKT